MSSVMGNLQANLRKLDRIDHPLIVTAMQVAGNNVVEHAKANHRRPKNRAERIEHSDPRFYTWTGHLVNSMRLGETQKFTQEIVQPVLAGDTTTDYAAKVEFGGEHSRAFPFMRPAMVATGRRNLLVIAKGVELTLRALAKGFHGGGQL